MADWKEITKNIFAVIGGLLGTGAVVGGGYMVSGVAYGIVGSTSEDLGFGDPGESTEDTFSEGSVGDLLDGLTAIPGDMTADYPTETTTIGGATGLGAGTTTTVKSAPDFVANITDAAGNVIGKIFGWFSKNKTKPAKNSSRMWVEAVYAKDQTPYSVVERNANMLYRAIHNKKPEYYTFPAIIIESEKVSGLVDALFGSNKQLGKMQETLDILETALKQVAEQ